MFAFIKKLFGSKPEATETVAPYKVEAPIIILPPEAEVARPAPVEAKPIVEVKPAVKKSNPPKKKPAASTGASQGKPRGRKPKVQ